ncbi:MAG: hypothetical protein R3264_00085 [Anaerolineae bacterium]|nr:hypothetical protein [Anaerolineae bacterium]
MPKQNRVDPFGELIADPARGTLMGNRGVLHDSRQRIKHHHRGKRWIICRLSFKKRQRQVMTPGRYTELFFLDEATALAAGHRPCAECMRARFNHFRALWAAANPDQVAGPPPSAPALDAILHAERLTASGQKRVYPENIDRLPAGAMITLKPNATPYLVAGHHLLAWSPHGYVNLIERPRQTTVHVLTPPSIVRTLRQGYEADLHYSASAV